MIATGFGGLRRRRRETATDAPIPAAPVGEPVAAPGFDVPGDVLDVPPFLRDS